MSMRAPESRGEASAVGLPLETSSTALAGAASASGDQEAAWEEGGFACSWLGMSWASSGVHSEGRKSSGLQNEVISKRERDFSHGG